MKKIGKLASIEEFTQVINTAWDAVNKSCLGPIIRDVQIKADESESWKHGEHERVSILNMAGYETYRAVLSTQLEILTQLKLDEGEANEA
jgi:hypothetical protein